MLEVQLQRCISDVTGMLKVQPQSHYLRYTLPKQQRHITYASAYASCQQTHVAVESLPYVTVFYLVVENASEVVPVGEDVSLAGQVGSSAVHQVQAGQLTRLCNLLQPQVLLQCKHEPKPKKEQDSIHFDEIQ
jgi:hypothetical protein